MTPSALRTQIANCFNKSELKTLCFDLSINYENLSGDTLNDKCRELIGYCYRHGQIEGLVDLCQAKRPHLVWNYPEDPFSQPIEVGSNQYSSVLTSETRVNVTPSNPLLVGLVIDFSRPMLNTISSTQKYAKNAKSDFHNSIDVFLERVSAFCKTPESSDILPLLEMFLYGYGFGQLRKRVTNFLQRLGIETNIDYESIPTASVRDLFSDAHKRANLSITPNALELNSNLEVYQQSIEAHFFDMGNGNPNLYEGILAAFDRFNDELNRPHYKYPVLFLISTGQLDDAFDEQLSILIHDLQAMNVIIACCYVGEKNLYSSKKFFTKENASWPQEAKRLFNCASIISSENEVAAELVEAALEKGWEVNEQSRLFIQLNNEKLFDELTEILIKPVPNQAK